MEIAQIYCLFLPLKQLYKKWPHLITDIGKLL